MLTQEDKARRIGRVTSSVAAACLGLDEHTSQIDAWLRITGQAVDDAPLVNRKAIERGNRLESYILDYPCDMSEGLVRTLAPFRSIAPWTGDSCDALYFLDNGHVSANDPYRDLQFIGEGKSASQMVGQQYGEEDTDEVPQHTLIQSHWHLIHWPEVRLCAVPVLVGGFKFEFRLYWVGRDAELEGILLQDLEKWHRDYVVGNRPPPVGPGDGEWLKSRYPKAKAGAMADTDELRELAIEKLKAAAAKKAYAASEEAAKNRIREILGEHEEVRGSWGSITWRNNQASLITDWNEIAIATFERFQIPADDRNAIMAEFTKEVPGPRVLRITANKQTKKELGL